MLHLEWDEPVELTLTALNGRSAHMVRGPQPETVRDDTLAAEVDDREQRLASVEGNYRRLRRHGFELVRTRRLALRVLATNGSKEARVFDVRCYGP